MGALLLGARMVNSLSALHSGTNEIDFDYKSIDLFLPNESFHQKTKLIMVKMRRFLPRGLAKFS
jgi:hypothetical protein